MVNRGIQGGQLRFFSRMQLEDIHAATLEALERVGLRSSSEQILEIFREGGADVDSKDRRVRIPQH